MLMIFFLTLLLPREIKKRKKDDQEKEEEGVTVTREVMCLFLFILKFVSLKFSSKVLHNLLCLPATCGPVPGSC